MTFNKKQNSCASISKNFDSVHSSEADDIDYSHNVCEIDRGMKIKNSFDEWKTKKGEPYDPSKRGETLTLYNTNLTTEAVQKPIIVEEEIKLDKVNILKAKNKLIPRKSAQTLSESLLDIDNQLSIGSLMHRERANSKAYTNSSNSLNQRAGSGSVTHFASFKKSAAKSKFFKEDPNALNSRPRMQIEDFEAA